MKNRKWQRVLSWLLTLTMLLGTFESNILAVNAMDDDAVEAEIEVADADEDVEEPEVVGIVSGSNKIDAIAIDGGNGESGNPYVINYTYGIARTSNPTFTATVSGDASKAVTWKLLKTDWTEVTDFGGLTGTANGRDYVISGAPSATGDADVILSAISNDNSSVSVNAYVKIKVAKLESSQLNIADGDIQFGTKKMGYTVDAASTASNNVVPQTITLVNTTGADINDLNITLGKGVSFNLVNGGTNLTLPNNGKLEVSVAPVEGLTVSGKTAANDYESFTDTITISSNVISSNIVKKVSFDLGYDMAISATKDGAAFTGNEISVSCGNTMPTLVFTVTGGNGAREWSDAGITDKLPAGVTANRNGDVLTISGKPTVSGEFVLDMNAKDNKDQTTGNNKISQSFKITVTETELSYTVNGENKDSVVKAAEAGYYQEDVKLVVEAFNNNESAVTVNASLDNSQFSFYPDKKQSKTVTIAANDKAEFVIYPETSVSDQTVILTLSGNNVKEKKISYRLICTEGVLFITEPADGKIADGVVGEAYSYTFKSEGTVSANARKWSISDNGAGFVTASKLQSEYGLTLSDNGVLSGTPKKVSDNAIYMLVAVSGNGVVSTNTVSFNIVSTDKALVVSANGVELKGKTASENVVDLGTVNTKATSVSNNTAKIWVKNASSVNVGAVSTTIVEVKKKTASGNYTGDYKNLISTTYTAPFNGNAGEASSFEIAPDLTNIIADGADKAGEYRALVKVNSNKNLKAVEFYVTFKIQNTIVITNPTGSLTGFKVGSKITNVQFNAVSKNVTSATPLKNVTWSWTASGNSTLPDGLTLSENGTLSGTPTKAGTFNVSVNVVDNATQDTDYATYTINVAGSSTLTLTNGAGDPIPNVSFDGVIKDSTITAKEYEVAVKNGPATVNDIKISIEDVKGYEGSAKHFQLSTETIAKINANGFEKFTVVPVDSSESGTFKANVVVSSNATAPVSFEVSFVVVDKLTINEVPADKLKAEVGQKYNLTVSAATISYNKAQPTINWTVGALSENGAYLGDVTNTLNINPTVGQSIAVNDEVFAKAGTYYLVVSANIAADTTLKVPANKAEIKLTIEVSKSASVNVIGATGTAAGSYSTGKSTPETPSVSNNVTAYTFASRAEGYDANNIETVEFKVKNSSNIDLTVSANSSSTDFVVTGGNIGSITKGTEKTFTVAPKKGLAAGTYTADITVKGAEVADQVVTVSFTVEAAKDEITLSANNAVIGEEGLALKPVKRTDGATDTTVSIKNTGNVDIKVVSVNEVLDANGTDIDINDTSKFKLDVSKTAAGQAIIPGKDVTFTVKPAKTNVAGEFVSYVKVTYSVGTAIKTPVVFKVSYTIYKDSVSVNVTPAGDTVSINGTATVSENYSSAYSLGFTVANGEAGVAGDTTEALYDLTVELTDDTKNAFELTATKVSENGAAYGAAVVAKGSSYNFSIAAKSGLAYGVYTATLKIKASNLAEITKTIKFTVSGKAGSYKTDATSASVSENVSVNAVRVYNTLKALSVSTDNIVKDTTAGGNIQFTVSNDIIVSFNKANKDEITESYAIFKTPHTLTGASYKVTRKGSTVAAADGVKDFNGEISYYDDITFDLYDIVTFDAKGGSFEGGKTLVSANIVNGGKITAFPSVSKNNASLKAWFDNTNTEVTTATTISQDMVVTASWSNHKYPGSASGNTASINWTWKGTASDNFAGTYVTVYCVDADCPDRDASAIKLTATITKAGKEASCETGDSYVYTATAEKDGNVYTDTQTVSDALGLGHIWNFDETTVVWADDYTSATISKNCVAKYHDDDRDGSKVVSVTTKNISFNGTEATCTTSGNGVYTATWTSAEDAAISENIVVSVNAAEVPALGHSYKASFTWTDNGYENTPSANVALVCEKCGEAVSENVPVVVTLVSENEAKTQKDYKGTATYEGNTFEDTYTVFAHTEHVWDVKFDWTGTTSENAVVTAVATCKNGGETVQLTVTVTDKSTATKKTYTATAQDPDGKEWVEKYTVDLASGSGKVGGGEGIEIRGLEESYPLTGSQIKPAITVWDLTRDVQLAEKVDYTVKYGKNKTAGEKAGSITVVGKGNYSGDSVTATFDIVDPIADLSTDEVAELAAVKKAKIEKIDNATFTGSAIYPETISVKTKNDGTVVMKSNGDGTYSVDGDGKAVVVVVTNNVNKGKATVAVTGSDAVTIKKTFKINAADINAAVIDDIEDTVYAVKGATPALKVTYKASDDADEIELVQGMDYTVSYKNNKAVGAATVTLKGKGNFAKKGLSKTFNVTAFDLSSVDEESIAVNASTGMKAGKVKVTIADANGTIIPAKQLKVEVFQEGESALGAKTALAAGEATIKISANGSNLTESVEKTITVAGSISKAKVKVNKTFTKPYTGEAVTLDEEDFNNISVTIGKDALVYGEDFVVASYANNIKKGKMIVTIEGIGNYSGTKTFKVTIKAQEMKPAE